MASTPRIILFAILIGVGGVLTLLTGCGTPTASAYDNPNELFREIGYEDAVQLSETQKKPMFLFFSESWVKDREKLLTRTLTNPATIQLLHDRTIGLQIEVSDLPDIAKKHKVATGPVIVLVGSDGRELRRWKNLPKAEPFAKDMAQVLDAIANGRQIAIVEHPVTEP